MDQRHLEDLICRSRKGDPEAQEALVEAAQNRVYYHCKKMLKQDADAQDAAQDVLIAMITGLDKLKEPAAFWGWVNGITANRCRHLLSAPHKEWQIPEDEEGNSMLESVENLDETLVPEKALDNEETRRMILGLVDDLPPEQRMCVLFYYYDEMSVKDIAAAMDTSEGTVKSRLNYARKAIKAGVEDYERKGIKLYSASPLVLLAFFLRQEAAAGLLDGAAAASLAGNVLAGAGAAGAAAGGTVGAAGGAAGSSAAAGSAAAAAGEAAAGGGAAAVSSAAAAGGAAGGGAAIGSAKLVAGLAAGAILVGGGVGLHSLLDDNAFGRVNDFAIVESQPYTELPVTLVLNNDDLTPLSATSDITAPEVTVTEPDGEGYVTYTATYELEAHSLVGSITGQSSGMSGQIVSQEYNLYDYYTGRRYLPVTAHVGFFTPNRATGTATVGEGDESFEIEFEKTWRGSSDIGSWVESQVPGVERELPIESSMSVTFTVRVPEEYDGVLLGVNVTAAPDPDRTTTEEWDLTVDDPSYFRFIRLSDAAEES